MLLSKYLYHWNILLGDVLGDVVSILVNGVTNSGCITSTDVGFTNGSDREVWLVDSEVVDGGTSTHGSCTGGAVWTGGSGSGGGVVQHYSPLSNFIKSLRVVSSDSKLGAVNDVGLLMS